MLKLLTVRRGHNSAVFTFLLLMSSKAPLVSVLALTTTKIKLLIAGRVDCMLDPDQALALILRYPARFDWDGSRTRVKKLIDLDPQPNTWLPHRDDSSWRSSGAAVLGPEPGYYESRTTLSSTNL